MLAKKRRAPLKGRRNAASAVEFAVIAPVILIFIFGMIESSWMLMASHATVGAAREATRLAAITDASDDEIIQAAEDYMQRSFFSDDSIAVDITREPSTIAGVENINCSVSIDYNNISLIGNPLGLTVGDVTGRASMMRLE